jgi:hypothetical protein
LFLLILRLTHFFLGRTNSKYDSYRWALSNTSQLRRRRSLSTVRFNTTYLTLTSKIIQFFFLYIALIKCVLFLLRVNPKVGLFYFDDRYRPIPLSQQYIGVKGKDPINTKLLMNQICFEKVFLKHSIHTHSSLHSSSLSPSFSFTHSHVLFVLLLK